MILRSFLAACIASIVAGAFGAEAKPVISDFKLANGLQVVVIPDHRTPVVTHMIWYRIGAADEQAGQSGIAHFLEHLMFKGTTKHPAGEFSRAVAAHGGNENAFTSNDYTGYYQRVPREQLETVMSYEADRMTGLVLTDAVVKPELQVVLEEQNQRVANNPGARLGEEIAAALFRNHPYGRPVIGWRNEIEQLNRDQALDFYRRYYAPNNAILVVAGDVSADEVRRMAEATYGGIASRGDLPPRSRPQEPPQRAERTVSLSDSRVTQPSLQRSYIAPSYATARPGEAEAIDVLMNILGSGTNSRLYRALVVEREIAVSVGAWYQGTALDATRIGAYGTPRPGIALDKFEAALDGIIAEVIEKGITDEELARAKTKLVAEAVMAQDNQATLARWYGAALTSGMTVADIGGWPERIAAVKAEEVRDVARRYFDKSRSVTGYLLPAPAIGPANGPTSGPAKNAEKRS